MILTNIFFMLLVEDAVEKSEVKESLDEERHPAAEEATTTGEPKHVAESAPVETESEPAARGNSDSVTTEQAVVHAEKHNETDSDGAIASYNLHIFYSVICIV